MSTIPALVRIAAARTPEREALVCGADRRTWRQLAADIEATAAALERFGLRSGDRCALLAPNGAGFVVAFFAAVRLGAIIVPVNTKLVPPEIGHILADSGAAVLAFDPALRDVAFAGCNGLDVRTVALGPCDGADDLMAAAAAEPATSPTVAMSAVHEDHDAIIMYTSGTTGHPKGVLLDHHRALWAALSEIASLGLRDGERYLHLAPLYHSGGVVFLVTQTLLAGTNVVLGEFDPEALLDAVERERCTYFLGVPTMFAFLLRTPGVRDRDLRSWRLGVFGAAPMPRETLDATIATFPDVELVQLCGQTEGGPGGIYATAGQVRERPDATGRQAMAFYESRVVDARGGEVSSGGVGELLLRGEGVMKGYWNQPEQTARTLRGGWLHTGDLVRVDADGYMIVVDRLKDLIITGGQNVYSVEVERVVVEHPAIAECAIVARPHPDYGESIVAVIVATDGVDPPTRAQLRDFCRGRIAAYKIPHDVVAVDVLPRNSSGKILKHELRDSVVAAAPTEA